MPPCICSSCVMRFIFQLFLHFLIPILVDSYIISAGTVVYCLPQTNKECKTEMERKDAVLKNIGYGYPPLTSVLKNYTEQCQNVMKCASGLECFKGKSEKEVYEKSCDNVGSNKYKFDIYETSCDDVGKSRYWFDYECMGPFLMTVFNGSYDCTKDVIMGDLTTENFKTHKQCFLKVIQEVCHSQYSNFFQKNYEDIVESYTTKPAVDEFCASPNDKFNRMQFDITFKKLLEGMRQISLLDMANQSSSKVQSSLELSRNTQKCMDRLCFFYENEKNDTKWFTDVFQALPVDLTKILKERPRLLEYKCLANLTLGKFFEETIECVADGKKNDCNLSIITHFCQEEILVDFGNLTVSMEPRKEVYNTPEFEFSMLKDKKNRKKFVFTVKNDEYIE